MKTSSNVFPNHPIQQVWHIQTFGFSAIYMKTALQWRKGERPKQLLEGIHNFLNEAQRSELVFVFHH
jgi:hypothetical protein